ncbi:MAG: MBL fold metallo-hydrolase [Spirochaetes bacterium]|jgi:ribonuclease BN (tRNA processing enzyme)|nr:MBL fold metallo-hydrolase [Spirochaetota bacterium]
MRIRKASLRKLPLTTRGQLGVLFLGTGSAFTKKNYQNNILIVKGDDHVMIDCGTRTPEALSRLGRSVGDIRNYYITHSHADHVGGLEEVMLVNRYVSRTKPHIYIPEAYQTILWERSLRGGTEENERHEGTGLAFEDFWVVHRPTERPDLPRHGTEVQIGGINLKTFRTRHFPEQASSWEDAFYSVGFVIDDRVLFTGDTQYDEELIITMENLFSPEVIFHDVQFFSGGIHASLKEINGLPRHIRDRIYLMHYPDSWRDHADEAKRHGMQFAKQWVFYDFPEPGGS